MVIFKTTQFLKYTSALVNFQEHYNLPVDGALNLQPEQLKDFEHLK